jgi:hypothetical protein
MSDLNQRLQDIRTNAEWDWETIPDFDFTYWPHHGWWDCHISIYGDTKSVAGRGPTPLDALEDAASKMPETE